MKALRYFKGADVDLVVREQGGGGERRIKLEDPVVYFVIIIECSQVGPTVMPPAFQNILANRDLSSRYLRKKLIAVPI